MADKDEERVAFWALCIMCSEHGRARRGKKQESICIDMLKMQMLLETNWVFSACRKGFLTDIISSIYLFIIRKELKIIATLLLGL
jgi:hypothetical protein